MVKTQHVNEDTKIMSLQKILAMSTWKKKKAQKYKLPVKTALEYQIH
jgi:hypothetical protein